MKNIIKEWLLLCVISIAVYIFTAGSFPTISSQLSIAWWFFFFGFFPASSWIFLFDETGLIERFVITQFLALALFGSGIFIVGILELTRLTALFYFSLSIIIFFSGCFAVYKKHKNIEGDNI